LPKTMSDVDQIKIKRQIADLEQQIQDIERQLGQGPSQTGQHTGQPAPAPTASPNASPAESKSRPGGWFARLSTAERAAVIGGIFTVIAVLITVLADRIRPPDGPTPTPTPMSYVVRVEGQNSTGTGIENAKVTLNVSGRPPLEALTDSNGVAVIKVPEEYVRGSAVMIVEATGFVPVSKNITLDAGVLPPVVQLAPTQ
jgi:hypothetical protein